MQEQPSDSSLQALPQQHSFPSSRLAEHTYFPHIAHQPTISHPVWLSFIPPVQPRPSTSPWWWGHGTNPMQSQQSTRHGCASGGSRCSTAAPCSCPDPSSARLHLQQRWGTLKTSICLLLEPAKYLPSSIYRMKATWCKVVIFSGSLLQEAPTTHHPSLTSPRISTCGTYLWATQICCCCYLKAVGMRHTKI